MSRPWPIALSLAIVLLLPLPLMGQQGTVPETETQIPSSEPPAPSVDPPAETPPPSIEVPPISRSDTDRLSPKEADFLSNASPETESSPPEPPALTASTPATDPNPGGQKDPYRNYFKKGMLRFGGSTHLTGGITQFDQNDGESEDIMIDLAVGYFIYDNVELSVSGGYDETQFSNSAATFDASAYTVLVGSAYYFDIGQFAIPYAGAGVGWRHQKATAGLSPLPSVSASGDGAAAQAYAGLRLLINSAWTLDVTADYRAAFGDLEQESVSVLFGFSFYVR